MERVRIRELRKEDSQKYFEWINNRELVIFNSAYSPISEMNHNSWFDSVTKSYQNRGFGTKVTQILVDFGFRDLNLNRIYLDVFQNNKRAIKTYTKCGFVEEGVKRESVFINGEFINIVQMSILSKEFLK